MSSQATFLERAPMTSQIRVYARREEIRIIMIDIARVAKQTQGKVEHLEKRVVAAEKGDPNIHEPHAANASGTLDFHFEYHGHRTMFESAARKLLEVQEPPIKAEFCRPTGVCEVIVDKKAAM